jgi:hypothetical protein
MTTSFQLKAFRINLTDLNFIRDQVNFKPLFDSIGNALINWDGTTDAYDGAGVMLYEAIPNLLPTSPEALQAVIDWGTSYSSVTASEGVRDVTGLHNNLLAINQYWGAADQAFMQTVAPDFGNYIKPMASGSLGSFYANKGFSLSNSQLATQAGQTDNGPDYTKDLSHPGGTINAGAVALDSHGVPLAAGYGNGNIVDYTPRMISRTITTGDSTPLVDINGSPVHWNKVNYAAGQADILLGNSTTNADYAALIDSSGVATATLIEGAAIITDYGIMAAVGQRDMQDPTNSEYFIGATNPGVAPGNSWLAYFGQFFDHGLDFIDKGQGLTPSKITIPLALDDPLYRAPNPLIPGDQGNTKITVSRANVSGYDAQGNAQWTNHTSPYIDQSQTYGSSDQMTQLLRKWVQTAGNVDYTAGSELLDGQTSVEWINAFGDPTTATLPTLNELRAHLHATGRDDLTWDDVSNLRNRDVQGHVSTGLSGQALLLDMNPTFNAAHFTQTTRDALDAIGIHADTLTGNYALGGPPGTPTLGDIIDFRSFTQCQLTTQQSQETQSQVQP